MLRSIGKPYPIIGSLIGNNEDTNVRKTETYQSPESPELPEGAVSPEFLKKMVLGEVEKSNPFRKSESEQQNVNNETVDAEPNHSPDSSELEKQLEKVKQKSTEHFDNVEKKAENMEFDPNPTIEKIEKFETYMAMKQFADRNNFRQQMTSVALTNDSIIQTIGKNFDLLSNDEKKKYLTTMPEQLKQTGELIQELVDRGMLTDDEKRLAARITGVIDKTEECLTSDDFTKNSVIFGEYSKIAKKINDELIASDENNPLMEDVERLRKERILEKKKKADVLTEKEAEEYDKINYVDPSIISETNFLLKASQSLLDQHVKMQGEDLNHKLIVNRAKKEGDARILLNSINLTPAIFGHNAASPDYLKNMVARYVQKDKERRANLPFIARMGEELALSSQARIMFVRSAVMSSPEMLPIRALYNLFDRNDEKILKVSHKLKMATVNASSEVLHRAGIMAGRAATIEQIKMQAKKDGIKNEQHLALVIEKAFDALPSENIVNIKSIMSDAKKGVLSPIVVKAFEQAKNELAVRSEELVDKAKDTVEKTKILGDNLKTRVENYARDTVEDVAYAATVRRRRRTSPS